MGKTSIQWTDRSWNPLKARDRNTGKVGHYCELIAPECAHCYASAMQRRFHLPMYGGPSQRDQRGEKLDLFLDRRALIEPLRWTGTGRCFPCSMTDLFGEWVPDEWLDQIFAVMALAKYPTFQVLTKRPERMLAYLQQVEEEKDMQRWINAACDKVFPAMGIEGNIRHDFEDVFDEWEWPLRNVWLGISAGTQKRLDEGVPILRHCAGVVHFVSAEPLLEPLHFERHLQYEPMTEDYKMTFGYHEWRGLDWVIVGGESGPEARPCRMEWLRAIVQQFQGSTAKLFLKQLGSHVTTTLPATEYWPGHSGPRSAVQFQGDGFGNYRVCGLRDRKGGDPEEWPEDVRIREYPDEKVRR